MLILPNIYFHRQQIYILEHNYFFYTTHIFYRQQIFFYTQYIYILVHKYIFMPTNIFLYPQIYF